MSMVFTFLALSLAIPVNQDAAKPAKQDQFARDRLVAWCIVPFDALKRTPEQRASMLKELGIKELAYDWRPEHIPTFDREVDALAKAGVHLRAFWFPSVLNEEAKAILELVERRKLDCELWVTMSDFPGKTREEKVANAIKALQPIVNEAKRLKIKVGLYNHGGWFGEPENQMAILEKMGEPCVGMVYNLHHGHDHLERLATLLARCKDKILCLNLNGMDPQGDRIGRKILQLGQGSEDARVLRIIKESGYSGPIGVLGHTSHDARLTLLDNLDGLEWLLRGGAGAKPATRTPVPDKIEAPRQTSPAKPPQQVFKIPNQVEFRLPPLTVDWHGTLEVTPQFQVLVASDGKPSPLHWELFQQPGGKVSAYLPGFLPDHIHTDFTPKPGATHTLTLRFSEERGEILVDGTPKGQTTWKSLMRPIDLPDHLALNGLVDGSFPSVSQGTWVRIRRGWRESYANDLKPLADADTVGLWKKEPLAGSQWVNRLKETGGTPSTTSTPRESDGSSSAKSHSVSSAETVKAYLGRAQRGNPARGAVLFQSEKLACVSCHMIFEKGGKVGPELTRVTECLSPEQIIESVIYPQKEVKPEFKALAITTDQGRILQGYLVEQNPKQLVLKVATTQETVTLKKDQIEEIKEIGSLMPAGLFESMAEPDRDDLLAFLLTLGKKEFQSDWMKHSIHGLVVVPTPMNPRPIHPDAWPNHTAFPNRERLYEFYQKQADQIAAINPRPMAVSPFPGLDQGLHGHWGNQNEGTWRDARWNDADLGDLMSGVCRQNGKTVAKGVAIHLNDADHHTVVYNPMTLQFELAWKGGFVQFSPTRHGFLDGLLPKGVAISPPPSAPWPTGARYRGFYRVDHKIAFVIESQGQTWLDSCEVENGTLKRIRKPKEEHPLAPALGKSKPRWPQVLTTSIKSGQGSPYAVDTIEVPFENPWKSPLFFGGLDFLPNGDALLGTMQGEIWRVEGFLDRSTTAKWRKVATAIHQALGLKVVNGVPHVLGRDQITRLHDLNGDGEYDFHECFSQAYVTSPSGHDYICGLEQDPQGRFVTASSNEGVLRIAADGQTYEVLATGFRNPDGIGLDSRGNITVPCSEGDWTPTSLICQIRKGGFYGFGGPREGKTPDLPMLYLPRGLDNSAGGQIEVTSSAWGPLEGLRLHFSFGACTHHLLLDDEVNGQPQGAFVPLRGDFLSGVHRARFHPKDGQLYVCGMQGWGTYAAQDGCFQRVRYTGGVVHLPRRIQAHENGIRIDFTEPVDPQIAQDPKQAVVLAWNYRYGPQYGSPEFLVSQPQTPGHEVWPVSRVHSLEGGKSLFLEIPDIQRANQIQVRLKPWREEDPVNLFLTVHELRPEEPGLPGYQPRKRNLLAHPILRDIRLIGKMADNPWKQRKPQARAVLVKAGPNLSFSPNFLKGHPGETIALTFENPDAVPHNWALIPPGSLQGFGDLINKQIADPDAFARQYIPEKGGTIAYTDVVQPGMKATIYFTLPQKPGRYPFVCTFPGHWMVMNGVLSVEP